MARLPRRTFPASGIFQITTRGVERRDVYLDRDDRVLFLELLRLAVERNDWDVYAVCLMTNHYHLVVAGMRDLLSRGMHRLNGVYAESFNAKYDRDGHLWGDRFALWQIRDDEHLRATCSYVLLNPVRAGLCNHPADWGWTWSRYGLEPG
jgi:REP element-mobilizing transposase RayT